MKGFGLITETAQSYWHFHPIGTGMVFTYHRTAKQVIICNSATGSMIDVHDMYNSGGFDDKEEFREFCLFIFDGMVAEQGISFEEKYFDQKIQSGEVSIGVDLKLLSN